MKRMILIGKSSAGKTSLTQKMRNEPVAYHKTQYVNFKDMIIDTPGEYAENAELAAALALYSYEADVVGLLISATDPFSLFPPNITPLVNREVIGIVTQIDQPNANPDRAERWLRLSGCKKVFRTSAMTGEGVKELQEYLL
ncbi:MAG: EutP/PduV family microcompartment system protein [Ruminococcaceae bacterium]|nr:EutP/PduV family microcompartment system protein [Oscillospiraceae bacterium]